MSYPPKKKLLTHHVTYVIKHWIRSYVTCYITMMVLFLPNSRALLPLFVQIAQMGLILPR